MNQTSTEQNKLDLTIHYKKIHKKELKNYKKVNTEQQHIKVQ